MSEPLKITTLGRGSIGGTLAKLWRAAGHEVTELGRDGGDATGSDVVLVAVPYAAVPEALTRVEGLDGAVLIDATNRLGGEDPPDGHASNAAYIRATTGRPVAKAFNLNFGKLLERAAAEPTPPQNIWTGDEAARAAIEQLTADAGMRAVHGGPLEEAATQEAFAALLLAIVKDLDEGLVFHRFSSPAGA